MLGLSLAMTLGNPTLNAGVSRIALGRNHIFGANTGSASGTDVGGTSTKAYKVKGAASSLVLVLGNERTSGAVEIDGYNAIGAVKATLEYPLATTPVAVNYAGQSSWSLPASGGPIVTDPANVSVADGATIRARYDVRVTSPERYLFNSFLASNQESSNHASQGSGDAVDRTASPGTFTQTGPGGLFTHVPYILAGHVDGGRALLLWADSIGAGRGWTSSSARQATLFNFFDAGITEGRINTINAGMSGATDAALVSGTASVDARARLKALDYATDVLDEMGINDIASDTVWSQLATRKLTLAALAVGRGKRYFVTTLTPRVTTTDNCLTTGSQTKSVHETKRTNFNDWVRSGCQVDGSGVPVLSGGSSSPLIAGYVDLASAVEVDASNALTVNGGLWQVPAAASSGPHTLTGSPTTTSFPVGAAPFTTGVETGRVIKMLTGTRAGQLAVIASNNTSSLTLYANGSTAQSGVAVTGLSGAPAAGDTFEIYDVWTNEGLHPAVKGHADMAAIVSAWLTSLGL